MNRRCFGSVSLMICKQRESESPTSTSRPEIDSGFCLWLSLFVDVRSKVALGKVCSVRFRVLIHPCGWLARVLCREMICVCLIRRKRMCQSLSGWWVLLLWLLRRVRSILGFDGDDPSSWFFLARSGRHNAFTKTKQNQGTWKERLARGLMSALVRTNALPDRLATRWAARIFFVQMQRTFGSASNRRIARRSRRYGSISTVW